jgi:hypothetical protein
MEHATGPKVLIEYTPRTTGRHTVNSHTTNESYGPRKRGDRFEVYRADMAVRPDLFRPVNEVAKPAPVVATRAEQARVTRLTKEQANLQVASKTPLSAPPPPPAPVVVSAEVEWDKAPDPLDVRLSSLDWKGTGVNKNHVKILMSNGITSLNDLDNTNEAELLGITGIGEKVVSQLYKKRGELSQ